MNPDLTSTAGSAPGPNGPRTRTSRWRGSARRWRGRCGCTGTTSRSSRRWRASRSGRPGTRRRGTTRAWRASTARRWTTRGRWRGAACTATRSARRSGWSTAPTGEPIPDEVLFPYPDPGVLGLTMDPKEMATVERVAPGSSAERDGLRPGDAIVSLAGQPLLSIADLQWVLHNAPATAELPARGPPRREDAGPDAEPAARAGGGEHLLAGDDLGPAADGARRDAGWRT